ncbi:MAG TPA: peptidyl-alpha-hydroxyglycine alpha-amidating lyase family protein [Candidatus Acidoferrales bacterium]|nr:peptidyl-alpha-hydroxyglycine alpha-amidating lyase family protein [Candidatus Acidoferrales bacterium]
MKRLIETLLTAALIAGVPAIAQKEAPEIRFDSVANALKLPADIYLGEVGGVATNSRGDIFVYTRTGHPTITIGTARPFAHGGSRLFQFDRTGKYVREIGKDSYAFMFASQVRVDPSDNIWAVDEMTNTVIKFDPQGRVGMLLGRKAENVSVPARSPAGSGAGQPTDLFDHPTDVAWDAAGNIFVADGLGNARVAKFDKDGKFVKSWGKKGTAPGEFANVRSIAVDAHGNVYAADGGNQRVQVFDNDGNFKTAIANVGNAQALCMTKGANQVLYVSNSNPTDDIDRDGEIYKMRLDGTITGKFGKAGKLPKEFGTVNAIDCSNENTLYVGEIGNLRVQKLILH